jgi:AraC family transcriptional regulator, transcriptional activator of pobA
MSSPPRFTQSFANIALRTFSYIGTEAPSRSPCFSLYLIQRGGGSIRLSHALHDLKAPALLCLNPYERASFAAEREISGRLLQFHANFFCIETHHHAVGCNGVLFNEIYEVPLVKLRRDSFAEFDRLMRNIDEELRRREVAHLELLASSLKTLLIKATRLKLAQQGADGWAATRRPDELRRLREVLEAHYRSMHSPAEYARLLGMSHKRLAQLVKAHHHKTLSDLIRERVMNDAKWHLLHTAKPVKQIADEVGFNDEFYFSRLFKRSFGCSPIVFREREIEIRKNADLSM